MADSSFHPGIQTSSFHSPEQIFLFFSTTYIITWLQISCHRWSGSLSPVQLFSDPSSIAGDDRGSESAFTANLFIHKQSTFDDFL